jgi:hypothetical protein
MLMRKAALVCLLGASCLGLGGTGCSFAFVDGPPAGHRKLEFFDCTTSNALPTVDLILSGALALGALSDGTASSGGNTEMALLVAEAGLFLISGIYGRQRTSACVRAQSDLLLRLGSRGAGGPAPDPWVGGGTWGTPPAPPAPAPPPAVLGPAASPGAVPPAGPVAPQTDPEEPSRP